MSDTITEAPPSPARPVATPRKRNWLKIVATVLLVLFLIALPILTGTQVAYLKVAQYILIGAVGGIGLTLLVGQAGQLSLAHPFFLLVGAVSYAVLLTLKNGDRLATITRATRVTFGPVFLELSGKLTVGAIGNAVNTLNGATTTADVPAAAHRASPAAKHKKKKKKK